VRLIARMSACAICLTTEVSVGGKNSCVTECGHIFCLTCILRASQENTACPLCRNVLVPPKNTAEETEQAVANAYENGRSNGYGEGQIDLEEAHAEELSIRRQQVFERGFISGRRSASEETLAAAVARAVEIDTLRREISRLEGLLSFERIKTEASAAALAALEQSAPAQTNPRAEALRASPNVRPTWIQSHVAHGAPWQS